jgi:hypothetical protein
MRQGPTASPNPAPLRSTAQADPSPTTTASAYKPARAGQRRPCLGARSGTEERRLKTLRIQHALPAYVLRQDRGEQEQLLEFGREGIDELLRIGAKPRVGE